VGGGTDADGATDGDADGPVLGAPDGDADDGLGEPAVQAPSMSMPAVTRTTGICHRRRGARKVTCHTAYPAESGTVR
jgi:hypothetical protein